MSGTRVHWSVIVSHDLIQVPYSDMVAGCEDEAIGRGIAPKHPVLFRRCGLVCVYILEPSQNGQIIPIDSHDTVSPHAYRFPLGNSRSTASINYISFHNHWILPVSLPPSSANTPGWKRGGEAG